jgi:hypothetical protein
MERSQEDISASHADRVKELKDAHQEIIRLLAAAQKLVSEEEDDEGPSVQA